MTNTWLDNYPRAAAMLQRDDDVLLYAPRSAQGLDAPPPGPPWPWEALGREVDAVEGRQGQLVQALIDLHYHMLQAGHAPDGRTVLTSPEAYTALEDWARTRLIGMPDGPLRLMGFHLLPGTDLELGGQPFALQDVEEFDRGDW
jgi:hypothetical protein